MGSKGLTFPHGAEWFISSYNDSDIKKIISGIMAAPDVAFDLKVTEITIKEAPRLESGSRFHLGSPVFIKRTVDNRQIHFTFNDDDADGYMTETLSNKLIKSGLSSEGLKVMFDRTAQNAKTKLSSYRNIQNKVSFCPVIIIGSAEQLEFAWNAGIGNSTGIGYGSLQ